MPRDAEAFRNWAWFLATCPDANYRDGPRAVRSARRSLELDAMDSFGILDALAAARAEAGDYTQAVACQKKVNASAPDRAWAVLRSRLDLYQSDRPFHQRLHERSRTISQRWRFSLAALHGGRATFDRRVAGVPTKPGG